MPRPVRPLLVLCALALPAPLHAADPPKAEIPKPLPKDVVAAWEKAGAEAGWFSSWYAGPTFAAAKQSPRPGQIAGFRVKKWQDGMLKDLPAPEVLFALDLSGTAVTDAGLKELAAFKRLTLLGLEGCTEVTDA